MSLIKPIIGVLPLIDMERNSIWMLPGYLNLITTAGGIPLMLPPVRDITKADLLKLASMCQGFLFTGGQDINPAIYHTAPTANCGKICQVRDQTDTIIYEYAKEHGQAVFGICRGIQFINAYEGGTLWQDLSSEFPCTVNHCQTPPYDEPVHKVVFPNDSPLRLIARADEISVNSYHHQAIRELASHFAVTALSEDGLIEGIRYLGPQFIEAVQWHPEFSYKRAPFMLALLRRFIEAASKALIVN